jgi:hypothetical protein
MFHNSGFQFTEIRKNIRMGHKDTEDRQLFVIIICSFLDRGSLLKWNIAK